MFKSENKALSPEAKVFKRFIISAITFVACMTCIVYSNLLIAPSTTQEFLALTSLILAIPAGFYALFCYIKLILTRFDNFRKR
jgi:hypothetical protein